MQVEADDWQCGMNEAGQQHTSALARLHHVVGGIHDFQQIQIGEDVEFVVARRPRG